MNASSPTNSVFVTLIPFAFFFLWLALQAAYHGWAPRRFSKLQLIRISVPLIVLYVGLNWLLLSPRALGTVPPVRMSTPMVPVSAPIADPAKLLPR